MTTPAPSPKAEGVCFPAGGDGRRSTTAAGRAIFADSVREIDPSLADRIEHTRDWHTGYVGPVRDIVAATVRTTDAAVVISRAGLASAHRRFRFARGADELPIDEAMTKFAGRAFDSVTIEGRIVREREFSLPYRGRRLFGDPLRRQVDAWVDAGIAEPSFGAAIQLVMANPDWLDLRDVDIAVLGASAEMGPTRSLLRWGARVHAVDLPRPAVWRRLIDITRGTAGSLRIPIALDAQGRAPITTGGAVHPDDDDAVSAVAGADLITQAPELGTWLDEIPGPFVLGTYVYADGATHVQLSMASDAIAASLCARRDDITLAFLATPTDAFLVPLDAVLESRRKWDSRGLGGLLQTPLRLLKQFEPNYTGTLMTAAGDEVGLNDSLVPQQGPNYALAKRIQRWRALAARADGTPVSLNLAPATRTQSVVRNRALAAAYAGAGRFGVEVFEPATSTALMAAMLVHDLRNPGSSANPATPLASPMDLFVEGANHGGLWRAAYSPRSVLGIAALIGMFDRRH